jgi:hypothetical protein
MTKITFAFFASALLISPALAQTAGTPVIKTLAENDKVIVTENWLKPGESAAMTVRKDGVFYYVQGSTFELEYKDGTRQTVVRKSGSARIGTDPRPYAPKNIGKTTAHVIVIMPK